MERPLPATIAIGGSPMRPLHARLAIVADGAASSVAASSGKRHDYGQVALVATSGSTTRIAASPTSGSRRTVRWHCCPKATVTGWSGRKRPRPRSETLALGRRAFVDALAAHFGNRVRGFTRVGERPLVSAGAGSCAQHDGRPCRRHRQRGAGAASDRGAGIQPRPARRVRAGAIIVDTPRDDIGGSRNARALSAPARAGDRRAGIAFTHGLVHLFGNDRPWLAVPRGVGMMLLDALPIAKRAFTRAMLFGLH